MEGNDLVTLQETLFGRPLTCTVTWLDDGIHVLFTGGDLSHIGSVSVCDPGSAVQTLTMPGHKEQYLSAPWSKAISDTSGLRCCVVCGIHYDSASPEQIGAVLEAADRMLIQVLSYIQK